MLATLEDLRQWSLTVCSESPNDRARKDLSSPLLSEQEFKRLEALDYIPRSYIDVVAQVALEGKSIGYFALWPRGFGKSSLVDALIAANSALSPYVSAFESAEAVEVASFEVEPIGVIKSGRPNEGAVVILDIDDPQFPSIRLAQSFEQFLLIAGSLDEARANGEGDDALSAFLHDLSKVVGNETAESWRTIGEVVLG